MAYAIKPLNEETWSDFARLVERHNGVWGDVGGDVFERHNLASRYGASCPPR